MISLVVVIVVVMCVLRCIWGDVITQSTQSSSLLFFSLFFFAQSSSSLAVYSVEYIYINIDCLSEIIDSRSFSLPPFFAAREWPRFPISRSVIINLFHFYPRQFICSPQFNRER